jgi:hypothetical protein
MKKQLFFLTFLFLSPTLKAQEILTPSAYLGYELGSRYTFHSNLEGYADYIVAQKPTIFKKYIYGKTLEGRNLFVVYHGQKEVLEQIDAIRKNHIDHLRLADEPFQEEKTLINWYSFNIHGDEAASSEAALLYLYTLATETMAHRDLMILDLCLNPDGRERYVSWFTEVQTPSSTYNPLAAELNQPWPQGRLNHYYFDLNRDWAWQKQHETKERLKLYHSWMPHVHADFHEMEPSKSYFFPPAAKPLHEVIEPWQLKVMGHIGDDLSTLFKSKEWEYFTEDEFDMLYPSYGDSYATYNGAIGLTLEQGGGDEAGILYIKKNGDTLTLSDRIEKHYEVAKVVRKTVNNHSEQIISNAQDYRTNTLKNGHGFYKTFVIKNTALAKVKALTKHLDNLQVKYTYALTASESEGYDFYSKQTKPFSIEKGDLLVSTFQAKGHLVSVLFEPETKLDPIKTYDISAWSLPYLYHLEAFALKEILLIEQCSDFHYPVSIQQELAFGFSSPWNSATSGKFLSEALQKKAVISLDSSGKGLNLICLKGLNDNYAEILRLADHHFLQFEILSKKQAKDSKKTSEHTIILPKVAVLMGSHIDEKSLGGILFYLEKYLSIPFTKIWESNFKKLDLTNFDILILPSGDYSELDFDDDRLKRWLADGGKLILLEEALSISNNLHIAGLQEKNWDEIKYSKNNKAPSNLLQGALFRTDINSRSPLSLGLDKGLVFFFTDLPAYTLTGSKTLLASKADMSNHLSGFVGENVRKELDDTFVLGSYYFGSGIIYQFAINPLFRGMLEDGKLLMNNALFMPIR